jgi:ABC-type transporter Mla MlaB component
MTPIASAGSPARSAGGARPRFSLLRALRLRRDRDLRVLALELSHEVLVVLDGHLVRETADAFERAVESLPMSARLVLDLSRLRTLDRAGVAAVRRLRRSPEQEVLAFAERRRIRRRLARRGGGAGLVLLRDAVGA